MGVFCVDFFFLFLLYGTIYVGVVLKKEIMYSESIL